MSVTRREFLRGLTATSGACLAAAMGWLAPLRVFAAADRAAFAADGLEKVLAELGATGATETTDVIIDAPAVANNGAMVPVSVDSRIAGTEYIALIAEKNPLPLLAEFSFEPGADAYVATRIKMMESAAVKAVVKAQGKVYIASRRVEVTIGGCGG
ncbi:MAG: thiosulfate oxidation carrier protein SoxY [Proteobacteria bacterium]|nr:MAG: thiosulfate oxidation carrier protein SoxY [Pseudomonadota bacterium]